MSKYVPFITWQCLLVAASAARNAGYWNVQDPEQLYGRLRVEGRAPAIPRISSHGLGAFMTAMNVTLQGFADVIDETQLSLELYFYARELNRADHVLLGLAPPGTGLLPPGEADVFAGRA